MQALAHAARAERASACGAHGQSKESPLYVTSTCGFFSRTSSKKAAIVERSSSALITRNLPSNSGLGVYLRGAGGREGSGWKQGAVEMGGREGRSAMSVDAG